MRYALISLTVAVTALGGLQAQAAASRNAQPTVERTARTFDVPQAYARRNEQIRQAWGDEPFGYGVQKALVDDRIVFGNPRPEARPLASTLEDFRQDIALSDAERERYSIISTAP